MARLGRYFLPGQPLHVIQRGNNRAAIFFGDEDYRRYRDWLLEAAGTYGCSIHAYVFMTNHVHLLVTPRAPDSLPRLMQSLGRRYVRSINSLYGRTGTLWEGRYRATPVETEAYFLACCRYIELNPVRAGMVAHPADYAWSSYRAHADGETDALVRDHDVYDRLAMTPMDRRAAYRALFQTALDEDFIKALRVATNGGWAFGSDRFKQQIAEAVARRVQPATKGRPKKIKPDDDQLNLL